MHTTYIPLTNRQKAELEGYVAFSTRVWGVVIFAVVALCIGWGFRYLAEHIAPETHFLWWAIPTVTVMVFMYFRAKRWTGGRAFRHNVRADLVRGEAAVHRIDVVDAIEVEEREDEGPSYFIKTPDAEIIAFSGQYLENYKRRGFPWASFEILEAPSSKIFLKLRMLGPPFPPTFVREPFDRQDCKSLDLNKEFKIIEADFEALKVKRAQPDGSANRSQPIRSGTNRAPAAAASRRSP